jgi:hypothetical protein
LFGLKLLGSSMDHETYIWEEFQVETTSFTGGKMLFDFGILEFFWDLKSKKSAVSPLQLPQTSFRQFSLD